MAPIKAITRYPIRSGAPGGNVITVRQSQQLFAGIGANVESIERKTARAQAVFMLVQFRKRSARVRRTGEFERGWHIGKAPRKTVREHVVALVNEVRHASLIDIGRKRRPAGAVRPSGRRRKRVFKKPFYTGSVKAPKGIARPAVHANRAKLREIAMREIRKAVVGSST